MIAYYIYYSLLIYTLINRLYLNNILSSQLCSIGEIIGLEGWPNK